MFDIQKLPCDIQRRIIDCYEYDWLGNKSGSGSGHGRVRYDWPMSKYVDETRLHLYAGNGINKSVHMRACYEIYNEEASDAWQRDYDERRYFERYHYLF